MKKKKKKEPATKKKKFDLNKPILLIKVGNDMYPASNQALEDMEKCAVEAGLSRKFNLLITHHAVKIQFVDPKNITQIDDLKITELKDLKKNKVTVNN